MLKKTVASAFLMAIASTSVFADDFYVSPNLVFQNIHGPYGNFFGARPNFTLGYDHLEDNVYLGGEFYYSPAILTITEHHDDNSFSLRATQYYGFMFLPGMKLTDKLVGYLRLGAIEADFPSPNTWKAGGQIGLGVQMPFRPAWNWRVDYTYTAFHGSTGIGSPKSNELSVGVTYKFYCLN